MIENSLNSWSMLSTSTISDAMDKMGIQGQCMDIKPLKRGFRIAGPAYTVKYIDQQDHTGNVGDYIDNVAPGQVIVIDNNGRKDVTVWGDILTHCATRSAIQGTIINGVCRDTASSLQMSYPIFSLGHHMRTGKDRVQFQASNVPLSFGAVIINPGDLIVGDDDGVLAIPPNQADLVLQLAIEIEQKEQAIIEATDKGMTLNEARDKFGYYRLQQKSN